MIGAQKLFDCVQVYIDPKSFQRLQFVASHPILCKRVTTLNYHNLGLEEPKDEAYHDPYVTDEEVAAKIWKQYASSRADWHGDFSAQTQRLKKEMQALHMIYVSPLRHQEAVLSKGIDGKAVLHAIKKFPNLSKVDLQSNAWLKIPVPKHDRKVISHSRSVLHYGNRRKRPESARQFYHIMDALSRNPDKIKTFRAGCVSWKVSSHDELLGPMGTAFSSFTELELELSLS